MGNPRALGGLFAKTLQRTDHFGKRFAELDEPEFTLDEIRAEFFRQEAEAERLRTTTPAAPAAMTSGKVAA